MSRFKFLIVSVALLFCSITVAYSVEVFLPIQGDLDKDGDVDFQDFLIFAGNFGKEGPVPHDPNSISQQERASKILGEWFFFFGGDGGLGGTSEDWTFMIGSLALMGDLTEVVYRGYRYNGLDATGYYLKDRDEYSLLYIHDNFTWFFLFTIEDVLLPTEGVPVTEEHPDDLPVVLTVVSSGNVYRFNNTYQTIEDARVLPIWGGSAKGFPLMDKTPTDIDYDLPRSSKSAVHQQGVPEHVVASFNKLNGLIAR